MRIDNTGFGTQTLSVVVRPKKSEFLQIRVSSGDKARIREAAQARGLDVSAWVLERLLPAHRSRFVALLEELARPGDSSFKLAALHDFLVELPTRDWEPTLEGPPATTLPRDRAAYVAAMVEHAAHRRALPTPAWVKRTPPCTEPVFGSQLKNLRLELLLRAPVAFRRRNIFIDSSVGDRL